MNLKEEVTVAHMVGRVDVQSNYLGPSPRGHEFGFLFILPGFSCNFTSKMNLEVHVVL